MARPLRIEYEGAVYHVTSRGNARNKIFKDNQDREIFLSILNRVVMWYSWLCHSYCLMDNCRYVVLNPVRAGVVGKPEDWRWSSYQATAGLRRGKDYLSTDWILSLFNRKRGLAQRQYRKFVRGGINRRSPWEELQGQVLLGEEGFVEKFKELLEDKKQVKEIPRPQRYVSRPSLDRIFSGQKAKAQRKMSGVRS